MPAARAPVESQHSSSVRVRLAPRTQGKLPISVQSCPLFAFVFSLGMLWSRLISFLLAEAAVMSISLCGSIDRPTAVH